MGYPIVRSVPSVPTSCGLVVVCTSIKSEAMSGLILREARLFLTILTGSRVERVLVSFGRAQQQRGGEEAADHAGGDHLGGPDGGGDDDGDEAAAEEPTLVEGVDKGRPRRGELQGAAEGDRVTLKRVHNNFEK